MRRKDIDIVNVLEANNKIQSASESFPTVNMLDCFDPTDDMYYDNVHLNNLKGLPALVKHLKSSMNMFVFFGSCFILILYAFGL